MREVPISEIRVNEAGALVVVPRLSAGEDFAAIYRAAMGVRWDTRAAALVSPVPESWSHFDWFRHIAAAVASEYGVRLVTTSATKWATPDELRREIETWLHTGA